MSLGDNDGGRRGSYSRTTPGSDILDTNAHELKLEKSNILLLGPTGSGLFRLLNI